MKLTAIFLLLSISVFSQGFEVIKKDCLSVVVINPLRYDFEVAYDDYCYTAKEWSEKDGYIAVVNGSMFSVDLKPLGLCKSKGNILNDRAISTHNMVFTPRGLIDLKNETFNKGDFSDYIQSIRMITSTGSNAWSKQNKKWSVASIGQDSQGNILLIHSRHPHTMHDFINKALNLGVVKMMYLEGGPEASMYVNYKDIILECIGSYETGFNENNYNEEFWGLPVIIGVKERNPQ